jgi:hypothetical protein
MWTLPTAGRRCCCRPRGPGLDGISRADSVTLDPHKWFAKDHVFRMSLRGVRPEGVVAAERIVAADRPREGR